MIGPGGELFDAQGRRRVCARCGVELSAESAVRDARKRDGFRSLCRACDRAARAARRADPAVREAECVANRVRMRARMRALAARTPAEVAADLARLRPDGAKRCRRGHVAPVGSFARNVTRPDGLQDLCREHAVEAEAARHLRDVLHVWEDMDTWSCVYCGGPFEHVDHVIPASAGGPDEAWNLKPACADCNLSKSDRPLLEWLDDRHPCLLERLSGMAVVDADGNSLPGVLRNHL